MGLNVKRKPWMALWMLVGWSSLSFDAAAFQQPQPSQPSSPPPISDRLQGQAEISQGLGSVLTFRARSSADAVTDLQVNLTRSIVPLPVENTALAADALGAVVIGGANGDHQHIDSYNWTVTPTSKLYLGRSGYKSLVVHYLYGKDRQSQRYTLDIACQTAGLKNQDTATCSLFGNGPLLKGDVRTTGQLTLEDATTAADPVSVPLSPTAKAPVIAPTPTPSYPGRGSLVVYPATAKAQEERYTLTRVTVSRGSKDSSRLTLVAAEPKAKTVVLQGQLEAAEDGQIFTITGVDGVPGQGKVFVGRNGLLRTTAPIFVGAEDQELSVYFRPN